MALYTRLQDSPVISAPCAFTFGTFDGVHLGHKYIFDKLKEQGLPTALLTFSNHPSEVITPQKPIPWLTSDSQKQALLDFDVIVDVPFDAALQNLSAAAFLERVRKMVPFSVLVVGSDVAFGKGREGNSEFLKAYNDKFNTVLVDKCSIDNEPVSSSRIRQAIAHGDFSLAEKLLGRPYVVEVKRISESEWDPQGFQMPPRGIYSSRVLYNDQTHWREIDVHVSSMFAIYERNETSHSAQIQLRN
jgi:riboflavin kinase/FMN adenylyltransferase